MASFFEKYGQTFITLAAINIVVTTMPGNPHC